MLFDTSAVSTSLPELKPVASISTPFACPGVKDIGKQCAHLAKPSLIFGVSAQPRSSAASVIAIRTKARWKNFASLAPLSKAPRRRLFQSSFPSQGGAIAFLHAAYNLFYMPLFSSRYVDNLGRTKQPETVRTAIQRGARVQKKSDTPKGRKSPKLKRMGLHERAAARMRTMIIRGELAPGSRPRRPGCRRSWACPARPCARP